MRFISLFSLVFCAIGCGKQAQENSSSDEAADFYTAPSHHIESLTKVFDAHGGYRQWSKMKSLAYKQGDETTITNLQDRRIRLESNNQTIGFDGVEVWVSPDSVDVSRARFYHNLYFYFYAMPFVVGDPGAYYEDLPSKEFNGKNLNGIKVSYNQGIGDAPDDNYIIWYDPDTYLMEWLMYTVTYRRGEPSNRYSLIHYADWGEFNGLQLPTQFQWYEYKSDSIGSPRSSAKFEDIEISENAPDPSIFEIPAGAVIAPL